MKIPNMSNEWSDAELKMAIKVYFKMLAFENAKTKYVKAEENRRLQKEMPRRSHKSIEYRWQNISAVLEKHKLPFIPGYKPARHVGVNVEERIWKVIKELI